MDVNPFTDEKKQLETLSKNYAQIEDQSIITNDTLKEFVLKSKDISNRSLELIRNFENASFIDLTNTRFVRFFFEVHDKLNAIYKTIKKELRESANSANHNSTATQCIFQRCAEELVKIDNDIENEIMTKGTTPN